MARLATDTGLADPGGGGVFAHGRVVWVLRATVTHEDGADKLRPAPPPAHARSSGYSLTTDAAGWQPCGRPGALVSGC
jgi:hypothetical protein